MKKDEFLGLKRKIDICDLADIKYGKDWDEFVSNILEGDEIWEYNTIRVMSGSRGYVIIRNDEVVDRFITRIS